MLLYRFQDCKILPYYVTLCFVPLHHGERVLPLHHGSPTARILKGIAVKAPWDKAEHLEHRDHSLKPRQIPEQTTRPVAPVRKPPVREPQCDQLPVLEVTVGITSHGRRPIQPLGFQACMEHP